MLLTLICLNLFQLLSKLVVVYISIGMFSIPKISRNDTSIVSKQLDNSRNVLKKIYDGL